MEWKRSDTLALSAPKCAHCHGVGLLIGRKGRMSPCNCVLRAVFRACYGRFRHCASKEKNVSRIVLEYRGGRVGKIGWGMKDEEYMADFCLVSRRVLNEEEYRIFRFHFLLGADWRLCCRKLHASRGVFFHTVYRIEQKLGRVFRELEPYSLFPLDEYFGGAAAGAPRMEPSAANVVRFEPVRPAFIAREVEPVAHQKRPEPISRTA